VIESSNDDEMQQQGQSRSRFISLVAQSSAPPQKGRAQKYHKWTKENKVLAVEEVRQTGGVVAAIRELNRQGSCLALDTKTDVLEMTPPRENRCSQMSYCAQTRNAKFQRSEFTTSNMVCPMVTILEHLAGSKCRCTVHKQGEEDWKCVALLGSRISSLWNTTLDITMLRLHEAQFQCAKEHLAVLSSAWQGG
jgi:hypothetical protein